MAIPREVKARRGDWILDKWHALLKFIDRTNKIVRGAGVRVQYLPSGGVYIYADDNFNPWAHPFKVSLAGNEARVLSGTVNGTVPAIKTKEGKLIRLDGTIAGDEDVLLDAPVLKVKPAQGARSYIALKILFTEEPVDFDPENIEAVQIVHTEKVPKLFVQGGAVINDDNSTLYPIAAVYWKDKRVRRVFQITHFNLNHRFVQGSQESGKPSRHLFWSA